MCQGEGPALLEEGEAEVTISEGLQVTALPHPELLSRQRALLSPEGQGTPWQSLGLGTRQGGGTGGTVNHPSCCTRLTGGELGWLRVWTGVKFNAL